MNLKKSFLLLLVIQFTGIVYCLNMDDVCSADDNTCKKPNLSGVGMIEKGKCSLTGVLLRFRQLSLLECAKKCFITSNCTSINYRQNWKLCDLVKSDDDENEIADDSTCIRSNITTLQKSLAGKCAGYKCEEGEKCEFDPHDKSLKCVKAYCKGLPTTPNAAVDERFGLRRNLDTGNKYKCDKDYKMKGNPFAVCQSPGEWKVLFNCTTKEYACSAEGFKYDESTKACIKLMSPKSAWEDARQNCQSESGGNLVSITTKEKWNFIIEYIEESGNQNDDIWVGLKDKKWMTGSAFENVFDIQDLSDSMFANKCGVINEKHDNKFTIKDKTCTDKKKFLCEILVT